LAVAVCKNCGCKFDAKLKIEVNKKTYCPNCGPQFVKSSRNFKNITDLFSEKWDGDREINFPLLITYINKMQDKYGVDYSEIYYVLDYMYNYADPPAENMYEESNIFKLIFYYDEARRFWKSCSQARSVTDEEIRKAINQPINVIKIKRSDIDKQHELALSRKEPTNVAGSDILDLLEEFKDEDLDDYTYDYSDEFKNFCDWDIVKKRKEQEEKIKQILVDNGVPADQVYRDDKIDKDEDIPWL